MLCDSVGIMPAPNNGTVNLPLKTVGVHGPDDFAESIQDPTPLDGAEADAGGEGKSIGVDPVAVAPDTQSPDTDTQGHGKPIGVDPVEPVAETQTPMTSSSGPAAAAPTRTADMTEEEEQAWLDQAESKIKGFWDWVKEKFGSAFD